MTERYRLSFTTGGLFLQESAIAAASFLQLGDWTATRAQLRVENLLQVRTSAAATRIMCIMFASSSSVTMGTGEYTPMPPVFGPRSPSKARLWSWAVAMQ